MELGTLLSLYDRLETKNCMADNGMAWYKASPKHWCALLGNGKWYKYYYSQYQGAEGTDFDAIAEMFYKESGCKASA